jgi:hypothetical protein
MNNTLIHSQYLPDAPLSSATGMTACATPGDDRRNNLVGFDGTGVEHDSIHTLRVLSEQWQHNTNSYAKYEPPAAQPDHVSLPCVMIQAVFFGALAAATCMLFVFGMAATSWKRNQSNMLGVWLGVLIPVGCMLGLLSFFFNLSVAQQPFKCRRYTFLTVAMMI